MVGQALGVAGIEQEAGWTNKTQNKSKRNETKPKTTGYHTIQHNASRSNTGRRHMWRTRPREREANMISSSFATGPVLLPTDWRTDCIPPIALPPLRGAARPDLPAGVRVSQHRLPHRSAVAQAAGAVSVVLSGSPPRHQARLCVSRHRGADRTPARDRGPL
jgi:hypothetical protein